MPDPSNHQVYVTIVSPTSKIPLGLCDTDGVGTMPEVKVTRGAVPVADFAASSTAMSVGGQPVIATAGKI